jgi:phage terminase large subunit
LNAIPDKLLDQVQSRAKRDPVWWTKTWLGIRLWSKQRQVIESVRDNPRTAVRSCHGAGKTFTAADTALWFLTNFPNSRVITTAPTFRQVEKVLWQEIRKAHKASQIPLGGDLTLTQLKIKDGWFAFGFSTDDPDAMQGQHAEYILVIMDEAPGVKPPIWEGANALLTSEHSRLLTIGNPTAPIGPFANEFKSKNTHTIKISAFDTPNFTKFGITLEDIADGSWEAKVTGPLPMPTLITPFWVAGRYDDWGPNSPMFVSRVLGDFPTDNEHTLIPLAWIEAAQQRELIPNPLDKIVMGLDIAHEGENRTVGIKRHGPVARTIIRVQGSLAPATERLVRRRVKEHSIELVCADAIGVGAPVVAHLVEDDVPVLGVKVGMPAKNNQEFFNLRAELHWHMREAFREGNIDIDPDDDDLATQLANLQYEEALNGKIKLMSKDDMKKQLAMESPDDADALALSYASGPAVHYQETDYQFIQGIELPEPGAIM